MPHYDQDIILSFLLTERERASNRGLVKYFMQKNPGRPVSLIYLLLCPANGIRFENEGDQEILNKLSYQSRLYISAHGNDPQEPNGMGVIITNDGRKSIRIQLRSLANFIGKTCPKLKVDSINRSKLRISLLTCYGGKGLDNGDVSFAQAAFLCKELYNIHIRCEVVGRVDLVTYYYDSNNSAITHKPFVEGYKKDKSGSKITFTKHNGEYVFYYDYLRENLAAYIRCEVIKKLRDAAKSTFCTEKARYLRTLILHLKAIISEGNLERANNHTDQPVNVYPYIFSPSYIKIDNQQVLQLLLAVQASPYINQSYSPLTKLGGRFSSTRRIIDEAIIAVNSLPN